MKNSITFVFSEEDLQKILLKHLIDSGQIVNAQVKGVEINATTRTATYETGIGCEYEEVFTGLEVCVGFEIKF